jgi:hypothetical protein
MSEPFELTAKVLRDMELTIEGVKGVSSVFGVNFYIPVTLSSCGEGVLTCYNRFLDLCPADRLTFYSTETMSRHKPVTKRALNMLPTWLKDGAPPRKFIAIELKSGEDYREAPSFKFEVLGGEQGSVAFRKKWANLISVDFPPEFGLEQPEVMLDFVKEVCGLIPYSSGQAGFALECSPYAQEMSQTHAWKTSMRHPGMDIHMGGRKTTIAAGQDALKGVGWLTILSDELARAVGGRDAIAQQLTSECEVLGVTRGFLVKAGARPAVGDRNRADYLPNYQSVYEAVRQLVNKAAERSPFLTLERGKEEGTQAWFRRFEGGD